LPFLLTLQDKNSNFYSFLFFAGDVKTTIKAGTKFDVTWHLGYPHQGGFRLELLDANEKHLLDLTPVDNSSKYVTGDTT
jgi:hypothetical protein